MLTRKYTFYRTNDAKNIYYLFIESQKRPVAEGAHFLRNFAFNNIKVFHIY